MVLVQFRSRIVLKPATLQGFQDAEITSSGWLGETDHLSQIMKRILWSPKMSNNEDTIFEKHRSFWMTLREALLSINNELEINLRIFPTTSQIRKSYKAGLKSSDETQEIHPADKAT